MNKTKVHKGVRTMFSFIKMAVRNTTRNYRRSIITTLTLMMGLFIVFSVRSLLTGFQGELVNITTEKMFGDIQIHQIGYENNMSGKPYDYLIEYNTSIHQDILSIENVDGVTGRITSAALINNQNTQETAFASITGINSQGEEQTCPRFIDAILDGEMLDSSKESWGVVSEEDPSQIEEATGIGDIDIWDNASTSGDNLPFSSSNTMDSAGYHQIMLSPSLMRGLNAEIGHEILILFEDQYSMRQALVCQIVGVIGFNLPFNAAGRSAYIDLNTMSKTLQVRDQVSTIIVKTKDLTDIHKVQQNIIETLNKENWIVERWDQFLGQIADIMFFQDIISSIAIAFVLLLAMFAIINTSLMTVMERYREIGTLMALGYKRRHIMSLFLLESSFIGILGGTGGLLFGMLAVLILSTTGITFKMEAMDDDLTIYPAFNITFAFLVLGIGFLASLMASLYPAFRASRLKPVEALASI